MRQSNVLLVTVCTMAVCLAVVMAWQWRRLPIIAPRDPQKPGAAASALDAVRVVASVMAAGVVAGVLVVGLGGRLVMRVLAATSGDLVQGAETDAGEAVGEITFGGTLGFVVFAGIFVPVATALMFVPVRRLFPAQAWMAGLVVGVLLLGSIGVSDPLSPENSDFAILRPRWLAVSLVGATALLYGLTFAALVSWFDATMVWPNELRSRAPLRHKAAYAALILLVFPVFGIAAAIYVVVRALSQGRIRAALSRAPLPTLGRIVLALGTLAVGAEVVFAARDILT
jgi:hypothetical protein